MKKLCFASLLFGLLVFSTTAAFINSQEQVNITRSPLLTSFSLESLSSDGYTFIWDDYDGAPGNQPGDDSLVFGSSFGPYHNYTELVAKLKNLNTTYPGFIDLFSIGKTYFDRDIYCVRITNESIVLPKTEVIIVGQHHAYEQITLENALYFIDKIVYDFLSSSASIQDLLNTKAIYVIPSLNIDGAELMSQYPWQRKTARPIDEDGDGVDDEYEARDINGDGYIDALYDDDRNLVGYEGIDIDEDGLVGNDEPGGVDPNRNYGYQFGNIPGSSDDPSSWKYHGPEPFSENCTARYRDFIQQRNFVTAVSLHSGMHTTMILGPWQYKAALPTGIDRDLYITTGARLQELTGFLHITDSDSPHGPSGEWGDWMYGRGNGTLLAFTFETYGNPSEYYTEYNETDGYYHDHGVWDYCNPPADKVISNSEQVYKGLLFMAEEAPYLSIQTSNRKVGNYLHIEVTVTNPSSYIRTNGSISLDFVASRITGLTLLNTTSTVNLGELGAESSNKTTFIFSIDKSDYSVHVNLRARGPKVGDAMTEYDLDPQTISRSEVSITIAGTIMTLAVISFFRRKSN